MYHACHEEGGGTNTPRISAIQSWSSKAKLVERAWVRSSDGLRGSSGFDGKQENGKDDATPNRKNRWYG